MDIPHFGDSKPATQPKDTARLLAEKDRTIARLQKKLEKYEAIFQGLSDGVLLIDEKLSECNREACQIWRCEKEDIIGFFPSDFAPLFQPDGENSYEMASRKVSEALRGNIQKFEWKDIRRDGMMIDTQVVLNRIEVDGKGYVLATFKDITDLKIKENEKQALLHMMEKIIEDRTRALQEYNESLNEEIARRKRTERHLEHAYMELEHIFDTSGDGILVLDSDRNIVRANLAFAQLVEKPADDILGKKCFDIFPCRHRCTDHCIIQEIVVGSSKTDFEKEFVSESGERKSCLVKAAALRGEKGEVLGIVKNYKDLTSYKRWVDMLQESEEFHRITLESIWDAIFLTTDEGRIVFVSCNVDSIFGYDADEIAAFGTIFDLVGSRFYSPHDLQTAQELNNLEVEITDKFGRRRVLIANVKRAALRSGTTLIAFRDITERKDAEKRAKVEYEQLVQAGKMVSLGILVSGVAHEINNPNNSIILNVPLLSRMWYDARVILDQYMDEHGDFLLGNLRYSFARERVPHLFSGVMSSSKRIKHIVQDLKNYARQGSTVLNEVIDINGVLKTAALLLDNQLQKATDRLEIGYGLGIPHFRGNFQKIEQVVINVLQNACEALDDRSKAIRIRTGFDTRRGQVWLEVADEGQGIQPDDLPHVTDPFYTTKRACGGTGLGLSISSRIMQEHGGELTIHSRRGEGTSVTLTFPVRHEGDPAV
ncbi:PAS domain-containing sensor histidine kinase [Desulfomicrobium salsuginis]